MQRTPAWYLVSCALLASLLSSSISAQEKQEADHGQAIFSGGYLEAVISVSDLQAYQQLFTEVGQWEKVHHGSAAPGWPAAWGLPDSVDIEELVLRNPGSARGYLRLVRFKDVAQVQIRPNGRSWDSGGWFDLNMRILDMDRIHQAMLARGWSGYSQPVRFAFGRFEVIEWLPRGLDGVVFAFIQRLRPRLEGWPDIRGFSRMFNATQVVADMEGALRFYRDQLGFKSYLTHRGAGKEETANVLGLPHNLNTQVVRQVQILHPHGVNEGSVELLHFEGTKGYDFSSRAKAPNLGILSLRFPVADAKWALRQLQDRGVTVLRPPTRLDLPPYGPVIHFAIAGPEGAQIECIQRLKVP